MKLEIIAQTRSELIAILKATDITVPLRTQGRTHKHVEWWTLRRLLLTLAANDQLRYASSPGVCREGVPKVVDYKAVPLKSAVFDLRCLAGLPEGITHIDEGLSVFSQKRKLNLTISLIKCTRVTKNKTPDVVYVQDRAPA